MGDPSAAQVEKIEGRSYVLNTRRQVELWVVRDKYGYKLKFYKLHLKPNETAWKVDLARFSVGDIDLFQMAADAVQLATKYEIQLDWPSLRRIQEVGVSVQTTPECPECHSLKVVELLTATTWSCEHCNNLFQDD